MKNIVIIGAGDLGKEVVWLIEDINQQCPRYLILGFLDDDVQKQGTEVEGYRVLGTIDQLETLYQKNSFCAVIAMQDGTARRRIDQEHQNFHNWESIIHPTAVVAPRVYLGHGSILFPQVTVSIGSKLGNHGLYYINSTICNDCIFGNYVSVMSGVSVSEHVAIGDESCLAAGCTVYPHKVLGRNVRVAAGASASRDCNDHGEVGKGFFFK